MLGFRYPAGPARAPLRRGLWPALLGPALALLASVRPASAQAVERPAEKVRVTYQATPGCPGSDAFFEQVRARVGSGWEAPPNELARTIEVRVTGGAEKSVARIDFVDENKQPIARVVTAATCDEVVTGIALVTALAIESRIAEAVGKSEAPMPAPAPQTTERASEAPETTQRAAPVPVPAHVDREDQSPPPRFDVGGGARFAAGALPHPAIGFAGFVGLGFPRGPDFRLGVDFSSTGSVETRSQAAAAAGLDSRYVSSFSLLLGRGTICPLAFGTVPRVLPCAGVELGRLHGEQVGSTGGGLRIDPTEPQNLVWFAPFLAVRVDAEWDIFFVEIEASATVPVAPIGRDFVFLTTVPNGQRSDQVSEKVYSIWPIVPGADLALGLRL